MTIEYQGKSYITDNDLKVNVLGFWPRADVTNKKLKDFLEENHNRNYLGGDELIAYSQSLVSHGMNFAELEEEILKDIENPENSDFREILFKKTATGIGRGHSLGGLSGVVLGLHGTKMLDSGLTGLCASRSLATSSRRRETNSGEIAIPENLETKPELLNEYMQISEEVFNLSNEFKDKFGKLGGVETFNKVIPYNNPADLFIVLPLDTLSTIASEVRADNLNPNGRFLPKELHSLSDIFSEIERKTGQDIMFKQRIEVPRDSYLHYTVFKDPSFPNYALGKGEQFGMSLDPIVSKFQKDFNEDFMKAFEITKKVYEEANKTSDPKELHWKSLEAMYAMRNFTGEFNEALRLKVVDSLSWRVWSEQKRHATLRQNVESVYSAAERAYNGIKPLWPVIEKANSENDFETIQTIIGDLENNIVIDDRLKGQKELIMPYVYQTAKQLMFYGKMVENGFLQRDALYIVPKNIRVRTLEDYDLANLIDLEFPLRLCNSCEPERKASSWKKLEKIKEAVPELDYFLKPKCRVGFCTEGKYCNNITDMREYNQDLHKNTKDAMLGKAW